MAKQAFEDGMKKLEQIVAEIEAGDLPLETALKKFEEGVKLSRSLSALLDETEKKIALLMKTQQGEIIEKPFTPPEKNMAEKAEDDS